MGPMSSTYSTWYSIICAKDCKSLTQTHQPACSCCSTTQRTSTHGPHAAHASTHGTSCPHATQHSQATDCSRSTQAARQISATRPRLLLLLSFCIWLRWERNSSQGEWLTQLQCSCNAVEGVYICDVPQLSTSPCTQHMITVLPLRCHNCPST